MKHFFISYNKHDRVWAEWIAWTLEEAGYSTVIQAWDFRPGGDIVSEMQKAATSTQRTIAVLSDSYLKAEYTQPEWFAAFARDPQGNNRTLIPIRIQPCDPKGLLSTRIYADLVGLSEDAAKENLLDALRPRRKPESAPDFPGVPTTEPSTLGTAKDAARSRFPGHVSSALAVWQEKLEFLRKHEAYTADVGQKFALQKQIEEAKNKIAELEGEANP